MPQTMATSDLRCSLPGASRPPEACTIDIESSTVTDCGPLCWKSISLRARQGRIRASLPCTRWPRLSLVVTATVRRSLLHRLLNHGFVGHRGDEVTSHADERLGPAVQHGPDGVDDI